MFQPNPLTAYQGQTRFEGGVFQPSYDPYGFTNQQNQMMAQYQQGPSPLYAQLMASMFGPAASMQNNQYGADTNYRIAEGNAWNERELQKMRNEFGKYATDSEAKSRTDVAGIGADASKYGSDRAMQGQLGSAQYGADAQKYGADKGYDASVYGADRNLEGTKYTQDAGVKNTLTSTEAQKAIAAMQAEAQKYAPGLQHERFNALLPMLMQLFQTTMARQSKGGTPYLGTMA